MGSMKIIRSNRKTISLCINRQGEAEVRAPYLCPQRVIDRFLEEHRDWLERNLAAYQPPKEYTDQELKDLRRRAKDWFPTRTAYYAQIMGVRPSGVKITSAKTRYGSCSPKGGICFSLYLMEKSERARDYVVVHELAHLLRRDHSKEFYKIVASVLPDYKERIKELKQ